MAKRKGEKIERLKFTSYSSELPKKVSDISGRLFFREGKSYAVCSNCGKKLFTGVAIRLKVWFRAGIKEALDFGMPRLSDAAVIYNCDTCLDKIELAEKLAENVK